MFFSSDVLSCFECGKPLALADAPFQCVLCDQSFCQEHLIIRKQLPNCAACAQERARREAAVSDDEEARVVGLVSLDVANTVGAGHEPAIEESAARLRLFSGDGSDFAQRVVEDVQQYLHDTFVDTTWPACPDHRHHPLWYSDGWWRCEKSGKLVSRVGELPGKVSRL